MIELRTATDDDLPALLRLNEVVQRIHVERHPEHFRDPIDEDGAIEYFRRALADDSQDVLVAIVDSAVADDEVAGYLVAELQRTDATAYTHTRVWHYVHQIAVSPESRTAGVGRALMGRAEELARARGADKLVLDTYVFNRGARDFFASCGLEEFRVAQWKRLD